MSDQTQDEFLQYVGGYPLDEENQEELAATSVEPEMLMMGELPEEVDPRNHPEAGKGFLQVEHQGSIGSCAGNALTECAEYCYYLATGLVMQFSRMFAYLVTQMHDGIRGDRGSTISGGTKTAAQDGFCPEADAPYPSKYPGWKWVTKKMRELAEKNKLKSHTVIRSAEQLKKYLGSGIGVVQIGISWGPAMTPDRYGCIRKYYTTLRDGGHSVTIVGYVTDETVGQKSSTGVWFLLKNSWGKRWAKGGYCYVDAKAIDQMIRTRSSTFVGRSDMETPKPRPIRVDFTKKSRFGGVRPELLVGLLFALGCVAAMGQDRSWIPPLESQGPSQSERIEMLESKVESLSDQLIAMEAKIESLRLAMERFSKSAAKSSQAGALRIEMHSLASGYCRPCETWKQIDAPLLKGFADVQILKDVTPGSEFRVAPTFRLFRNGKMIATLRGYHTAEQIRQEYGKHGS